MLPGLCLDCFAEHSADESRCRACRSPRLVRHPELHELAIAHIDCDAFYAAIEKRDRPELRDVPVIVGGSVRGVVSTACYIARIKGVRSAMPMFKALKLCPEATVIKPDMNKYSAVSKEMGKLFAELTPAIQFLSIDEAFLDLQGTARLHGHSPAVSLAGLASKIEKKIGITVSIGLSHNKFLAKIASDISKPRGFSIVGKSEATSFLAKQPVGLIWGVGQVFQKKLARDGITKIGQLQKMDKRDLMKAYGSMGLRLYFLSRGEDHRSVESDGDLKSVSSETTFDQDISDGLVLRSLLWTLCEKVARRAKAQGHAGHTVTLKLKTSDFRTLTRSVSLSDATQLANRMFDAAEPLLNKEANGTAYRLLGVGITNLQEAAPDASSAHTLDDTQNRRDKAEAAMDKIRSKFGQPSVVRGIALGQPTRKK
jgi:DNA polymerase IV